jgi:hypothetical protein
MGLTFDTRMNWLEHIKNTKTRAEKKINIIKFHMGSPSSKPIESTPNDSPEERRRSIRISYKSSAEEIRTEPK